MWACEQGAAHRDLAHLQLVSVLGDGRLRNERVRACVNGGVVCKDSEQRIRGVKRTTIGWSAATSTKRRWETSWTPFSARLDEVSEIRNR